MELIKNLLICWKINSLQQKIKNFQSKGLDVKLFRARIAALNRKRNKLAWLRLSPGKEFKRQSHLKRWLCLLNEVYFHQNNMLHLKLETYTHFNSAIIGVGIPVCIYPGNTMVVSCRQIGSVGKCITNTTRKRSVPPVKLVGCTNSSI